MKNKKNFIYLGICVLVCLLVVILALVFKNFGKSNEKLDNNIKNNDTNINLTASDISTGIKNGENYTKEQLVSAGFKEVDIDTYASNNLVSPSLNALETKDDYSVLTSNNKKVVDCVVNKNIATLNYYNENEEIIDSQTIENVKSMYVVFSDKAGSSDLLILTLDGSVYQLQLRLNGAPEMAYSDATKRLKFSKLDLKNKYQELYPDNVVNSYIGRDETGKFRFLNNETEYTDDIYKTIGDVTIFNNREIKLKDSVQTFKYKVSIGSSVNYDEIEYIISDNNKLYDTSLKLHSDNIILSVFEGNGSIVILYENGKNELIEYSVIK